MNRPESRPDSVFRRLFRRSASLRAAHGLSAALLIVAGYYFSVNALETRLGEAVHVGFRILFGTGLLVTVWALRRWWATWALWAATVVSFTIDRVHFDLLGTRVTMGGLYSMFETDSREAVEFLSLVSPVSLAATGLFVAGSLWLTRRFAANVPSFRAAALATLVLAIVPNLVAMRRAGIRVDMAENPLSVLARVYKGVPLVGNGTLTLSYVHEKRALRDVAGAVRPDHLVAGVDEAVGAQIVTVVIGESSTRHHYPLYGYAYPTTPFLSESAAESDFAALNQAVASAPITRESLKQALTFATVDDDAPYREYWNVVDLANAAGYRTVWISNQDPVGPYDTLVGAIAHRADERSFISNEVGGGRLDIELSERYAELLRRYPSDRLFVVVHLIGSHYRYETRSDDADKAFVAGLGSPAAAYDATLHHTDRTMRRIVESTRHDGRTHAIVYFSDHGEEVAHGVHGTPQMSDMQVDVPFFLWTRDGARGTARLRALRANGSRLFSLQDTVYLVSDLLGWQVREQDRLVTSSEFVERMPRIRTVVGTVVPYRTVERLADLRGE